MVRWHVSQLRAFPISALPRMPQDVTAELPADTLIPRNEFTVDNLLNVKKKNQTQNIFLASLVMRHAAFGLGNDGVVSGKLLSDGAGLLLNRSWWLMFEVVTIAFFESCRKLAVVMETMWRWQRGWPWTGDRDFSELPHHVNPKSHGWLLSARLHPFLDCIHKVYNSIFVVSARIFLLWSCCRKHRGYISSILIVEMH